MKKQSIQAMAAAVACVAAMSGCSVAEMPDTVKAAASISLPDGHTINGRVVGEPRRLYYTKEFSFTVNYIRYVPEYAGYSPANGNRLLDVSITENGIADGTVKIGTYNFYVLCGDESIWPIDPFDPSMMPLEFELEQYKSADYHMLYELPEASESAKLVYIETDGDGSVENMLTINIEPE